ncbi:MmgE/PrpD family protein, partial [Rubrimonas sp.]|uniref:MmgE/PrpD family protein n=1 Tax=Rubrimonas sp. TaxID=2036015 RepID=UPI002FDECA53
MERTLAGFVGSVRFEDLPSHVVDAARRSLVNVLATAFAGCREAAVDKALAVQSRYSRGGDATVLGRPETTDMLLACMLNGMAANIHDFDDTHPPTIIHPSAPVAPAVVALAQERILSGEEALRAFVIGAEITCRLGNAVSPSHYARGWHITSTCGVFGSATAAAAILGLDEKAVAGAIANAAAQSAGMVQTLGTMSKSISVG